eukprot:c29188_g1_i1 orf=108-707(-)
MARHSSSTSSLNLPSDYSNLPSPCSSSSSTSPVPHQTQHDSILPPLPPPPSQALPSLPQTSKESKVPTSHSFIRRRSRSVSTVDSEDPFVLALKACTSRGEEDNYNAGMLKGERACPGGLHTMFMGLFKPVGRKVYEGVEASSDAKSANPMLNLLQFSTNKKKHTMVSDLLGCKSIQFLDDSVVHPSLIYRKRRLKPRH